MERVHPLRQDLKDCQNHPEPISRHYRPNNSTIPSTTANRHCVNFSPLNEVDQVDAVDVATPRKVFGFYSDFKDPILLIFNRQPLLSTSWDELHGHFQLSVSYAAKHAPTLQDF